MKQSFIKKLLFFAVAILGVAAFSETLHAQYANSWIHFTNTYYKFKVYQPGIYRITQAQLAAMNMGNVTGNQFAIFREGQEVPVYVSTNGTFGNSDYIEFYGDRANSKMDQAVYLNGAADQPNNLNIISDTAFYFITYDNSTHQRLPLINNAIPQPAPAPAAFCWATAVPNENNRNYFSSGYSHALGTNGAYYYSSDFERGEGFGYAGVTYFDVPPTLTLATPQAYSSGPSATAYFNWFETNLSVGAHPTVSLNGGSIYDTTTIAYQDNANNAGSMYLQLKRSRSISPSSLQNSNIMKFVDAEYNSSFAILDANITYPRTYDFSGNFTSQASFQIPAADRYIEISNFNTGGQSPRLYDVTNNKVYLGTETGGVVKFYLDISAVQRNVFLSNVSAIAGNLSFKNVQFRDYSQSANQGSYIILSHKDYINASPNYISQYKAYRSSIAGGSFSPVVVDVTELYDQFAYGFEYHPLSIRNFLLYANGTWTPKPQYLFIIGRGVDYSGYLIFRSISGNATWPLVPTWGNPGSDNLFSSFNNSQIPTLATGRLSAWSNDEIGQYLTKIQNYEAAIKPLTIPTVDHEYWKKKVLHIAGGINSTEQASFVNTLSSCESIIEDTLIGGTVTVAKKTSSDPIQTEPDASVDSLFNNGVALVSYYGHGASSGFSYSINSPDNINSSPRFPIFGAYACDVAYIFSFTNDRTISENYIRSVTGGSVAMIASDNIGWTGTLPYYMSNLYKSFSYKDYGKPLGMQYRNNLEYIKNTFSDALGFTNIHIQCQMLQGDPGTIMYNPDKPDYVIEESGISSIPANVTTEQDTFQLKVNLYNLGKATRDSVFVRMQHTIAGNTTVLYKDSFWVHNLLNSDTVLINVPLNAVTDVGLNNYTVKIDANDKFDELSEMNNEATFSLFIYSENLVPLYPKEFAIIHDQNVTLKASTLNAFAPLRNYRLEMDTTENFNSTLKQSTVISSIGGVIKWKPNLVMKDSTVYYWRAAPDSLIQGSYSWSKSSFVYLANGSDGWNQSHYFQYLRDLPFSGVALPASNRKFSYSPNTNKFEMTNKVVTPPANNYFDVTQSLNDVLLDTWGCGYTGSVQISVIDSTSGQIMNNTFSGPGLYGSIAQCFSAGTPRHVFEFPTYDSVNRNKARLFIESIAPGSYIAIKNIIYNGPPGAVWDHQTADKWIADTATYGSGKSLYHVIKNMGFTDIDQFTSAKAFVFFRQKGIDAYPVRQQISSGTDDAVDIVAQFNSYPDTATVTSTIVGPALEWQTLRWHTTASDNIPQNDSDYVEVTGIDTLNHATLLFKTRNRDTSLSFIDHKHYPNLSLRWNIVDNTNRTADQLDYWRVLYKPVPEAALNAAAHYVHKDTTSEGQQSRFEIAIENLTPYPMDSMLVFYKLIDAAGIKHNLDTTKKYKPLLGNDTLITTLDYDISSYHGKNYLMVEANPNNNQPEQYHPNNIGNLSQYVIADNLNPVLDITFDGIHILDKDIVSAKPFIKAQMRDENQYLALNDSSAMKVQLLYPNQSTPVDVPLDGTICKFIPAVIVNGTKNQASIEYKPTLTQDGVYTLIVSGKDRVGNTAGNSALNYKIEFTVDNTPSITNVLNYPNPFSTATKFVFTLTGSEIPSQFKIQILSVTGKVVREIKKTELGNLHIGRNITDYTWDGKDEYGQMLGNGVYLYRVVTSIRGEDVEHKDNANIDKYFKNGYGKLYIMR